MAKKKLYIIGARGFGRETYETFLQCPHLHDTMKCAGFLDDKSDALDGFADYPPIISSVEDFIPSEDDVFICALGDSRHREKYTRIIEAKGGDFINLIHPSARISPRASIGKGCIIKSLSNVSCNCKIGNHVVIQGLAVIGHDAVIGDYTTVSTFAFMGGFSRTERSVTLNPGAILLPHKHMGEGSVAGAGAVVIRNVKPNTTVFGNPATKL